MKSIVILSLSLSLLWLSACAPNPTISPDSPGNSEERASSTLNIVTTVSPLSSIIYNIGGERINLSGIVPEGTNSHTFEPAPSDAKKLAQADLIFINGLSLEQPTLALAEANKSDDAEIILLGEQNHHPH